ncbi:MAG: hypothetical protein WBL02_05175 [Methanomethylovorans sp.]|uniref:hypothetical protein n=1 Tax=Methanomethylovorans sp. TaxID=2758717 RepID=UPI000A3F10A5|nr:hypothetical protein [Methanomethylovorans sp.]
MDKMKKVGILGAAALIGAGLAALSEERIREFVKEKVDTGALSKEEGKVLVEDLVNETKKQKLNLEKNIVEKIRATVLKADKELANLEDRITETKILELEAELEKMKSLRKTEK